MNIQSLAVGEEVIGCWMLAKLRPFSHIKLSKTLYSFNY